ncbi:hypothetical protein NQ016_04020 [Staphylococcus hyicus]|uniref:hypothetical protein n=1 Tax=Staphylococcus hyicus TaxID=1284 RepID=UPI00211C8154|nr:hypothetical protein [Staphylococcus hyicus]MCQ9290685.1 hypothetical protein [Staphylococcus hyicus]MCQ9305927.1 hypothetical protein [Staphylococcus hyicus]MCQ9308339.1 hypothetical protein [Staphylococcus hyicus]MCQ9310761.1 hypothetical protein [Staphylococcus hyicus]
MKHNRNAKQVLMNVQRQLQDNDDVIVVFARHDEENEEMQFYIETTYERINDKLGALESAKLILWENS